MSEPIDVSVKNWMRETQSTMSQNICSMGYPNGGRDAAPAERNVSMVLASILMRERYSIYAEASLRGNSKARIDLLAANQEHAFAIEFKRRVRRVERVEEDVKRLVDFRIQTAKLSATDKPSDSLFSRAKNHWGLFVASNFEESAKLSEAWLRPDNGQYASVRNIVAQLDPRFGCCDTANADTEVFKGTGAFRLYWLLFKLD